MFRLPELERSAHKAARVVSDFLMALNRSPERVSVTRIHATLRVTEPYLVHGTLMPKEYLEKHDPNYEVLERNRRDLLKDLRSVDRVFAQHFRRDADNAEKIVVWRTRQICKDLHTGDQVIPVAKAVAVLLATGQDVRTVVQTRSWDIGLDPQSGPVAQIIRASWCTMAA